MTVQEPDLADEFRDPPCGSAVLLAKNAIVGSQTGLLGGKSLVLHTVTGDNTPGILLLVVAYRNTTQNSIKAYFADAL